MEKLMVGADLTRKGSLPMGFNGEDIGRVNNTNGCYTNTTKPGLSQQHIDD
jgi:hypothetical protein